MGRSFLGQRSAQHPPLALPGTREISARVWLGAEARELGSGGVRVVADAVGVSPDTVRRGREELDDPQPLEVGRSRVPGGGRKRAGELDPGLADALDKLVDPETRGDPMTPLRWTVEIAAHAGRAAARRGPSGVGDAVVRRLLHEAGLQPAGQRQDRRGHVSIPTGTPSSGTSTTPCRAHQADGQPVISVDAKKKELIGQYKNGGREWTPAKGSPERVNVHDFTDRAAGKAIPYGVYDVTANTGWVGVGTDHDTAAFAVATIRPWWTPDRPGRLSRRHPAADHRRRRRLQRLPRPGVEDRTGRPRRRDRPDHHRLPPAARYQQVEQNRAPAVLLHHHELARQAPDQPRSRHRDRSPRPPPPPG